MCGITGIFDTRGQRVRSTAPCSQRMNESQPTAGRTRAACTSSRASVSVTGGCRSSTSPPASSRSSTRTARVVVVFNGEIYNYQALIPELRRSGHVFHTQERHRSHRPRVGSLGRGAASKRFRGMFAFALWDRKRADAVPRARPPRREAAVLRAAAGRARCCSAPSSSRCWRTVGCRATSIRCAVEEYFALGYVAEPRTIFAGARKLPPAHTLTIRRGEPVPRAAGVLGRRASRSTSRADAGRRAPN